MIIITSKVFDAQYSPLVLHEIPGSSNTRSAARRLSRSATLDGGAVIDDAGFSDGDRTLTVALQEPSGHTYDALKAFIEGDGAQRIATRDGVFEGGILRITEQGGKLITFGFLVETKLSG